MSSDLHATYRMSSLVNSSSSLRFYLYKIFRTLQTLRSQTISSARPDNLAKSEILQTDRHCCLQILLRGLCKSSECNPMFFHLILETICGTGIRVSELRFFTAEAVKRGEITVSCKSKTRTILLPSKLKKMLLDHAKKNGIRSGAIFITRNGKPLDRSNIWAQMKSLCEAAGVKASKVFPHNLRKLFARTFYGI